MLNIFTLTFIDITLVHDPVDWGKKWGDSNILKTGYGVEAEAKLQLANSAWARVGLFGGGCTHNGAQAPDQLPDAFAPPLLLDAFASPDSPS